MYPETTPPTINYIWRTKQYEEELTVAFKSVCKCRGGGMYGGYPTCVRFWNEADYNWNFYLEMAEIYFNSIEAYLVEHYPLIAMEAFLLQDVTEG